MMPSKKQVSINSTSEEVRRQEKWAKAYEDLQVSINSTSEEVRRQRRFHIGN